MVSVSNRVVGQNLFKLHYNHLSEADYRAKASTATGRGSKLSSPLARGRREGLDLGGVRHLVSTRAPSHEGATIREGIIDSERVFQLTPPLARGRPPKPATRQAFDNVSTRAPSREGTTAISWAPRGCSRCFNSRPLSRGDDKYMSNAMR